MSSFEPTTSGGCCCCYEKGPSNSCLDHHLYDCGVAAVAVVVVGFDGHAPWSSFQMHSKKPWTTANGSCGHRELFDPSHDLRARCYIPL